MPERGMSAPGGSGDIDRIDRLNREIDRLIAGQPSSVLDDPDLQELVLLAGRLHGELPRDLPDPAFREDLKTRLIAARPAVKPAPVPASRSWLSFPAVAGALAAVLLVFVAVGMIGLLGDDDDSSDGMVAVASTTIDPARSSSLAAATSLLDTPTIADLVTMTTPPEPEPTREQDSVDTPEPTERIEVAEITQTAGNATQPATAPVETATPTPAQSQSPPTATLATTAEPTSGPQLANLPPVDGEHVQMGPAPMADGGSSGPGEEVTYELAAAMPEFPQTATVYQLLPPREDPEVLVSGVAGTLGLDGEVAISQPVRHLEYHVDSSDGSTFHWTPATGAFSYYRPLDVAAGETPSEPLDALAREWLVNIGYPADRLVVDAPAQSVDGIRWEVTAWLDALPQPGIGYPVGVTVYLLPDGSVVEARGYWLVLADAHEVTLASAEDIWAAITRGDGYWTGGGIVAEGGAFVVDMMTVSYILTIAEDGALILQPVVKAEGEFEHADGQSTSRIACFVQAGRNYVKDNTP